MVDDAQLGRLLRTALQSNCQVFISRHMKMRGYEWGCILSSSQHQETESGATVRASVDAHGEGPTPEAAIEDALAKLPSRHAKLPRQDSTLGARTLAEVTPRKAVGG